VGPKYDPPPLIPIAGTGEPTVEPKGPETASRYLGVYQSLKPTWERQHKVQTAKVERWTQAVVSNEHTLLQAIESLNTVVVPRLEVALGTATTTGGMVKSWDKAIRRTVRSTARSVMFPRLADLPLHLITGLTQIEDQRKVRAGIRAVQRLNYRSLPDGVTAWGRVQAATNTRTIREAALRLRDFAGQQRRRWPNNRIMRAVRDLMTIGITPKANPNWHPRFALPPLMPARRDPREALDVRDHEGTIAKICATAYTAPKFVTYPANPPAGPEGVHLTDQAARVRGLMVQGQGGSTRMGVGPLGPIEDVWVTPDLLHGPLRNNDRAALTWSASDGSTGRDRRQGAGIVMVTWTTEGGVWTPHRRRVFCWMRRSPNNYVPEACGLALQLHLAPRAAPLHMITDSKALYRVVKGWLAHLNQSGTIPLTERNRIRQGARPFMEAIRMRLMLRGRGNTWLSWQTSHSGALTASATLLAQADSAANVARTFEAPVQPPEYTFHEERLIWSRRDPLTDKHYPILGDVRKAVTNQIQLKRLLEWSQLDTQGALVRAALGAQPSAAWEILAACRGFRTMRSNSLLTYAALALTSLLPTEYRLRRWKTRRAGSLGLPPNQDDPGDECRLCRMGESETMSHVLVCPTLGPMRTTARQLTERTVLSCLVAGTTSPRVEARVRAVTIMTLSSRTDEDIKDYIRLFPPKSDEIARAVCGWPRWLLHLGIVPTILSSQFEETLARAIAEGQGPGGLKRARRRTAKIWKRLSIAHLQSGFQLWVRRTANLRAWWRSPEAATERTRTLGRNEEMRRARKDREQVRLRAAEEAMRVRMTRDNRRRAAVIARDSISAAAVILNEGRTCPDQPNQDQLPDPAAKRYPLL
jgi:hypothetical protein